MNTASSAFRVLLRFRSGAGYGGFAKFPAGIEQQTESSAGIQFAALIAESYPFGISNLQYGIRQMAKSGMDKGKTLDSSRTNPTVDSQIGTFRNYPGRIRKGLGRLSGAGEFSKAFGSMASGARISSTRIGSMLSSVFIESSPKSAVVDKRADMRGQFNASMKLHRIGESQLARMVGITRRNFNLYLILLALASALGCAGTIIHPPDSVLSGLIRFAAIPILAALAFKHAYSNWLFRNRRLSSPIEYFRSGDIWPKATGMCQSTKGEEPERSRNSAHSDFSIGGSNQQ